MTIDEILEFMLSFISDEYDTSPGSFFYDVLYSVAKEAYQLQSKADNLSNNALALTAVGEYLEKKVAEQNIYRKSATYSTGTVRISGSRGEIVVAGSKVASDDILFAVDETVTIPEAGYVDVGATCISPGAVGNVAIGVINRFPVTLPGLTAVTNITDFTGGYDEETDAQLLERYLDKVSHPTGGGNKYQYIAWAKEVEGVGDADCIPLWDGPGTVKVVITDTDNQPAEADLITKVSEHIESKRLIGASVTVVSAESLEFWVSLSIVASNPEKALEDIAATVKSCLSGDAVKTYSSDTETSKYISYAAIGTAIYSLDSVEDYSDLLINGADVNIDLPDGYVPVLKGVHIT